MKKMICVIGFFLIIAIGMLSGCQETKTTGVKTFEGVSLVSNVVTLSNASFKLIKDKNDIIVRAEVQYLFHNPSNKPIRINVTASFCDNEGNVIFIGGPKHIYLLEEYTERSITGANSISYDGEGVEKIDHVIITAIPA